MAGQCGCGTVVIALSANPVVGYDEPFGLFRLPLEIQAPTHRHALFSCWIRASADQLIKSFFYQVTQTILDASSSSFSNLNAL
jgi:hypothetical protein